MQRLFAFIAIVFSIVIVSPVSAAEKSAVKTGFAFPSDGSAKILVFRPDVSVGEQSTGGLNEPNVEWTNTALELLSEEMTKAELTKEHKLIFLPEYSGEDGKLVNDYQNLFEAVTGAVVSHKLFPGNRLPTKKNVESLEWNMGTGTQKLAELGGGDYGLFFYTYDSYGSAGRKVAQVFGALLGAYVPSGVHIGYAGLVNLQTGDLVWINADLQMGGDVREPDGAKKRVSQLLEDFPVAAEGTEAGAVIKEAVETEVDEVLEPEPAVNTVSDAAETEESEVDEPAEVLEPAE